ncbi:HEPN domain-containing protein [Pedobacter sp. MC2016-05]|uniref:HEPN domain-containing protein n=1 Tax=Pedobacter sp. MC2016-05 TaxID=2994474 RepID=UPI002247E2B5|nr:HEPN domain-containing protein [Pedobacter sp. MC2016-05]MCX2476104.1 HEPN domain-containing protein [Pedobacter sp. MC2016-05]
MKTNQVLQTVRTDCIIELCRLLIEKFKPIYIYSFCKLTQTATKSGCFGSTYSSTEHHYFLLMVMESKTRNEHEAQDFCNTRFFSGKITMLSHSMETIQCSIEKNNRFFISILNAAQHLYSSNGILNETPSIAFDSSQNSDKASKHYAHRIKLAAGFLEGAADCYSNEHYAVCLFMTHQVIEQCTIALIRVHLAYRSDIHHLGRQLDLCSSFSSLPYEMLKATEEDRRLFEILLKSYSQARYNDKFSVQQDDADKLLSKAYAFEKLTRKLCENKISEFERAGNMAMENKICFE